MTSPPTPSSENPALVDEPADPSAPVRLALADIQNPPRESFVLGRMLPLGKPSVFFGPMGKGKSALIAQIAFALAAGAPHLWGLDMLPGGGAVLIFTAEDTKEDWELKGAAIMKDGKIDVERALERLWIMDRTGEYSPVRLLSTMTFRENMTASTAISRLETKITGEVANMAAYARRHRVKLIIIETVSNLVDEEDNPTLASLISVLRLIAERTGAAVVITHHSTKSSAKENDSAVENLRGGYALAANARNVLSLYPAEPEEAKPYRDRFPAADLFVLRHAKPTSSTRAHDPMTLVRTDATYGAVFHLPGEVALTPEQEQINTLRLDAERQREAEALRQLYEVVEKLLPIGPVSPSRLREHVTEIGIPKRKLDALISSALDLGFLKTASPASGGRGLRLALGFDPRKPIAIVGE